MPYSDITISQICQRAGIARQTFYRNFETKDDVIRYYLNHLISHYSMQASGDMEKDLKFFFMKMPFSEDFLKIIINNHLVYLLQESCLTIILHQMKEIPFSVLLDDHKYDIYMARYLADTMVSILLTWASNDFKESNQELFTVMQAFLTGVAPGSRGSDDVN